MDKQEPPPIIKDARGLPTQEWLRIAYVDCALSLIDIAKRTGMSTSHVLYYLDKYDIPRRQYNAEIVSKEWLWEEYHEKQRSAADIANELGVRSGKISYLIRKYEIPVHVPRSTAPVPTEAWLREHYVDKKMSLRALETLSGYSMTAIVNLLKKYDIPIRTFKRTKILPTRDELYEMHVVQGLTAVRIAAQLGCNNSTISRLIKLYHLDPGRQLVNERLVPSVTRDELWKMYWVDNLSMSGIAQKIGFHKNTVKRWFKILGVETRPWNGGIIPPRPQERASTDPAKRDGKEFDAYERQQLLERDQHRCQMPGCGNDQQWQLEAHHIIPIEQGGDNALDNGIILCRTCHASIRNREMLFSLLFMGIVQQNKHH